MPDERYNAEEVVHKRRGTDVLLGWGETVRRACKQIGASDRTYYRWRKTDLPQFVVRVPMLVQAAISHPSATSFFSRR